MLQTTHTFDTVLKPYQYIIEQKLKLNMESFGEESTLKTACEYSLLSGGKRFRPALVLMIAKGLGYEVDVSQAALAVEYFHTASLIADDLPCMDNDDMRRDQPTVHKKYGESIALLSTYALISAGYACLVKCSASLKDSGHPLLHQKELLCVLALENATYNTGIQGATGGQLLDLQAQTKSAEELLEIIDKKTVTLFEISFVLGWIFGGGELTALPLVKKGAQHFGRAFQIADDLEDQEQDAKNSAALNFATILGREQALQIFNEEMFQFKQTMQKISFHSQELLLLIQTLKL